MPAEATPGSPQNITIYARASFAVGAPHLDLEALPPGALSLGLKPLPPSKASGRRLGEGPLRGTRG